MMASNSGTLESSRVIDQAYSHAAYPPQPMASLQRKQIQCSVYREVVDMAEHTVHSPMSTGWVVDMLF